MRNILHIYGQGAQHDDVLIVGDEDALGHLQTAIFNALHFVKGVPACSTGVFVNDGEGYNVRVLCLDQVPDSLAVPYGEDIAKERRDGAMWPNELFKA